MTPTDTDLARALAACHRFRWLPGMLTARGLRVFSAILAAVAATRWRWPEAPALGMVTFIDRAKVRPTRVRGRDVWGWTYLRAGFEVAGETKGGLIALRMPPDRMPEPEAPIDAQSSLWP